MQNSNTKNYLLLHFIVFIWGFTAILGKLISLKALELVWWRMLLASGFIFIYLKISKIKFELSKKNVIQLIGVGIIIALHWLTFYHSIKVSNVSIAVASLSTGAFFVSFLEPIINKSKFQWLDLIFGLFAVVGLLFIAYSTQNDLGNFSNYLWGIIYGLVSAFLSASFSVFNGNFAKKHDPVLVSFVELFSGFMFLFLVLIFTGNFDINILKISFEDLCWLLLLSSICTAFAFIISVKVMKHLSPFTVMLSINLEPVYGIIFALILFPETEKMNHYFYVGTIIILITVILNGILKSRAKHKILK